MQYGKKKHVLAAVAGAVVGAGAVIASVIAMKDKKNQAKVRDFVSGAKELVEKNKKEASDQLNDSKESLKKVASRAIKTAEKVTKSAKKEVKKI